MLYKDKYYYLMRLGFGLNYAPKIMSQILQKVLSMDAMVKAGTDHYIDDILVDESLVLADHIVLHLQRYGLRTKPPERIHNGAADEPDRRSVELGAQQQLAGDARDGFQAPALLYVWSAGWPLPCGWLAENGL